MFPIRSITKIYPLIANCAIRNSVNVLTNGCIQLKYTDANKTHAQPLQTVRCYAKGKQKEKARNKGIKFATYKLPEEQLNGIVNVEQYRNRMQKAVDLMQSEYIKNLSLRSTTGSIDTIKVKVDGEEHELQDIAQIIRKNPKTIVINMVAFPQFIKSALEALQRSGMNLNPQQEGTTLYITIPKVTKEHRMDLAKNAKAFFVKCRDNVKNVQNEFIKKVKNNTSISEDDNHAVQAQLTEIANDYVEQAEKIFETKQKELLNN